MNSTLFHHRSHLVSASTARPTAAFDDTVTRKALERWENEGGRVSELFERNHASASGPRKPAEA